MIFTLLSSFFLTFLLLPLYKKGLVDLGRMQTNYQGKEIPVSFGLFIFLIESLLLVIYAEKSLLWLPVFLMALIGTYDDWFGNRHIKGFHGHFKAFFQGILTSGFLKAMVGGAASFYLGFQLSENMIEFFVHFFLILLMMNMINLFDLRPGRSLKVFFLFFFSLGLASRFFWIDRLSWILLGILLIVFFQDVHAKIMLGDSGANILGLHLGFWYTLYLGLFAKLLLLLVLIALHFYAEKFSITQFIENNRVLKRIDLWGRKGMG